MTGSGFQAFLPVIPVSIIILLVFVSAGISWWSYNYLHQVKPLKKYGLIGLRSVSLFILLILLLNPLFINENSWEEKPVVLIYLDDSQSTGVERGEYSGIDDYESVIRQFDFGNRDGINFIFYKFSGDVLSSESADIQATGSSTNLDNVFKHQLEQAPDAVAAIIISDGIITHGQEPYFSAQNSTIPFYTVPVGDTTAAKDVAVSDLESLKKAYTNSSFAINSIIQQEGYDGRSVTVELREDGELINSEQVSFIGNRSSHELNFELIYEEAGIRNYEIHVSPLDDELIEENNSAFFSVDVEDGKTNIWYLAYEVHPDVGAIRNIIARDQSFDIIPYTWANSGRFIEGNPDNSDLEPDLLVIHGLPQDEESIDWLIEKMKSHSSLFINTPGSYDMLHRMQNVLFDIDNPESFISVRPELKDSEFHPVFDIENMQSLRLPILQTRFGNYNISAAQQVLGMSLFQNQRTDIPYLLAEETGNTRKLFLNAFNWYKYSQSNDPEIKRFTEQFFTNIVSWTSAPPGQSNLQVSALKSSFNENEEIIIRASLQNESGLQETDGLIDVKIDNVEDENVSNSFTMQHQGNGNYRVNAGTLPAGRYQYSAAARIGNRIIDERNGAFSVTSSTREFMNTKQNDRRLQQLANITGGKFLSESSAAESFFSDINEKEILQTVEKTSKDLFYLHQFYYWFFVVMITLSAEWILRRSVSLP
jgi:hypothetical protein